MRNCRCGIWLKTASCPSRFLMLHGLTSTVGWSIWAKCSEWWQSLSHLTTERQNCSNCGEAVKKSFSQRTHRCSQCGHIQDRDWNAALNILELGLRTVGHTGTLNASGDIDLCIGEETPQCKSSHGKRKPKKWFLESRGTAGEDVKQAHS